jgi:hypothetical protein
MKQLPNNVDNPALGKFSNQKQLCDQPILTNWNTVPSAHGFTLTRHRGWQKIGGADALRHGSWCIAERSWASKSGSTVLQWTSKKFGSRSSPKSLIIFAELYRTLMTYVECSHRWKFIPLHLFSPALSWRTDSEASALASLTTSPVLTCTQLTCRQRSICTCFF